MTYEEFILIFRILMFVVFGLVSVFIFIKRHEIISFFQPDKYALITMMEADNNCNTWLQKKNSDLTFTFNEGTYNMFDLKPVENPTFKDNSLPPTLFKKSTAIYRTGRLSHFFYNEGNQDPVDFRQITSTNNPQLTRQLEKTEVMRLFVGEDQGFLAMLQKALPWLILVGIIILIILMTREDPGKAVETTQNMVRG